MFNVYNVYRSCTNDYQGQIYKLESNKLNTNYSDEIVRSQTISEFYSQVKSF